MNLQWIINTQNIEPDNCIAVLTMEDGTHILHMFEDKDCHYTVSCEQFNFIRPMKIPHSTGYQYLQDYYYNQLQTFPTEKILEKRSEYARMSIQENATAKLQTHLNKDIIS